VSQFTFEAFQDGCRECVGRAPSCGGWTLSFRAEDFEREWHVTAHAWTFGATVLVPSASARASNVPFVIAELGKILEELRSGAVDATSRRNVILDELGVRR
jgi:hypothetical protein